MVPQISNGCAVNQERKGDKETRKSYQAHNPINRASLPEEDGAWVEQGKRNSIGIRQDAEWIPYNVKKGKTMG
jgi:hypothetical protein